MSRKSKAALFIDEEYGLTVTGRNLEVTDAMKAYAIEKLSKIEKYNLRIVDVNITMDIQKLAHRIDIVLKVDHIRIKSQAVSENMYASIDMAFDKLQAQMRKYHSRIRDHHAKGVAVLDMNVNVLRPTDDEFDINNEIEEANQRKLLDSFKRHEVVNTETLPLKVLTTDEAIMKMDLSGDRFMIFRGEEDMKLKVIYRRTDGNYGVIEPEA